MDKHCENATAVAEYLADHVEVSWVNYPGVESHETHDEASEYLEGGYGGMITFSVSRAGTAPPKWSATRST